MPKEYRTAQLAAMMGVHPNTVRLYEECGFLTKPQRKTNGYRVFTDLHVAQVEMARTALRVEVLQGGLRRRMIEILKLSAQCRFEEAIAATQSYIGRVQAERANAEQALVIAGSLLCGAQEGPPQPALSRRQTADRLGVSTDTLRNWERNGLLCVKRTENGYRVYTQEDLRRLTMIRSLRCANYSLSAILRMLNALSGNAEANLRAVLDTPKADEDIVTACDRLLTSLDGAESNARQMLRQLKALRDNNPG